MTITARNVGRINVWPTYDIAREADTEECKFIGQLTVWRTPDEARANISHEEEGGPPDALFDFRNTTYTVAGSSVSLADHMQSDLTNAGVTFNAGQIANGVGYASNAGANYGGSFKGDTLVLLKAGARIVMEFEVLTLTGGPTIAMEWFDAPNYNTDMLFDCNPTRSRIRDFGSGGVNDQVSQPAIGVGVHTIEVVKNASTFSLSVDETAATSGTPVIVDPITDIYFSMSGVAGGVVRSITIYATP